MHEYGNGNVIRLHTILLSQIIHHSSLSRQASKFECILECNVQACVVCQKRIKVE